MDMDWRGKAFVVGGVLGALLGLGAAYIYVNAAEQSGETPELSPGTAVSIGLSLLALLRQEIMFAASSGVIRGSAKSMLVVAVLRFNFDASSIRPKRAVVGGF